MKSSLTIGIDLGTTNSVVAYWDGTQAKVCGWRDHEGLVPSVFSWQLPAAGTAGAFLVGRPALNNWKAAPEHTVLCVKRLMGRWFNEPQVRETRERFHYRVVEDETKQAALEVGERRFSPVEISAQYLQFLRERAERELGQKVSGAVVTVPAYFEERQRAATRQAGEKAGLLVKKIIDEPTAAAIAFGLSASEKRHQLLVFDLGGGTFDISIMQLTRNRNTGEPIFEVQEIDGDNWLGGSDFDQHIVDFVVEDFKRRHGIDPSHDREFMAVIRQQAELRKIDLSKHEEIRLTLPAVYRGEGKPIGIDLVMGRPQFEEMIRPEVNRAMKAVERALKNQSLQPEDLTTVLLVGGATKTPLVRRRLAELFGPEKINTEVDPMTSVAMGAAVLAARLKGIECPNPKCGESAEIKDSGSGKAITVFKHHVNDESRTTCEKCNTPLAAGRSVAEGIHYSEVTACSLGILAVMGDQANAAYVCLIPKGKPYPLAEPIARTFWPAAQNTRAILVPVFEAVDNVGTERKLQGQIRYQLNETITANTPVDVAFNLDRNRVITVTIQVKGSSMPPRIEHLELGEPPAETARREPGSSWEQTLENLVRHLKNLLARYGDFLEPRGLQKQTVADLLREAEQVWDAANTNQPPTPQVQKVLAKLEKYLLESGPGTYLYLADLVIEGVGEGELRRKILVTQEEIKVAFQANEAERAKTCVAALTALLAKVRSQHAGASTSDEPQFDPAELLRADK